MYAKNNLNGARYTLNIQGKSYPIFTLLEDEKIKGTYESGKRLLIRYRELLTEHKANLRYPKKDEKSKFYSVFNVIEQNMKLKEGEFLKNMKEKVFCDICKDFVEERKKDSFYSLKLLLMSNGEKEKDLGKFKDEIDKFKQILYKDTVNELIDDFTSYHNLDEIINKLNEIDVPITVS